MLVLNFLDWEADEVYFKSAVDDICDEAFSGSPTPKSLADMFFVRKRNRAIAVCSYVSVDTWKPTLSPDQLHSLTKIIVSRLWGHSHFFAVVHLEWKAELTLLRLLAARTLHIFDRNNH